MKLFSLKIAIMMLVLFFFACNKSETDEAATLTIEGVVGRDLLKQIEVANQVQHELVLQTFDELKQEGEVVDVEQINKRIEENSVGFKSSSSLEIPITISVEKLNNYAQKYAERLQRAINQSSDETTKEDVFFFFETEKTSFINEVLEDYTLGLSEKRDIIVYTLVAQGKMLTKIDTLDDVKSLSTGEIATKGLFSNIKDWWKRNKDCLKAIAGTVGGVIKVANGDLLEGSAAIVVGVIGIVEECFETEIL